MAKRGRPTKYRKAYCDKVVELGKQGKSKAQMALELNVCRDTLDEWCRVHQEFSDAITRARDYALAWWEEKAQLGIEFPTAAFNAALYGKVMAARFPEDYRDRSQVDNISSDGSMSPRNLDDLTDEQLAAIATGRRPGTAEKEKG